MSKYFISVIMPIYNAEKYVTETMESLANQSIDDYEIIVVNDGSKDRTWSMIEELHEQDPIFAGVKLSRNRGHQNALLAGLFEAKEHADMIISMDADLQDDIDVIDKFVDEYYNGSQIVYGVRKSRKTDTFFKRTTAIAFYKLMRMMGVELVYNHADYRLMSKRAVEELEQYKEVNLFLRGLVPLIGFESSVGYSWVSVLRERK